jgi:hypothetical protein
VEVALLAGLAAFLPGVATFRSARLVGVVRTWPFTTDHRRIGP